MFNQVANQFVNLTPHTITLFTPQGVEEIPASGNLCRVRTGSVKVSEVSALPVYRDTFESPEGLPEPRSGVIYVVSGVVLAALKAAGIERTDIVAPGTGPLDGAVRDDRNRVVGVTRLKTA